MEKINSIEEKARAYDEALARAQEYAIDGYLDAVAVNEIFTELKGSEDKKIRETIVECVKTLSDSPLKSKCLAWLEKQGEQNLSNSAKTCKDEPKASWSEEDEACAISIIEHLKYSITNGKPKTYKRGRLTDWIFSLKERCTWKPSDAQMQALKDACDEHWEPDGSDPLYTLFQDLRKLRGVEV